MTTPILGPLRDRYDRLARLGGLDLLAMRNGLRGILERMAELDSRITRSGHSGGAWGNDLWDAILDEIDIILERSDL